MATFNAADIVIDYHVYEDWEDAPNRDFTIVLRNEKAAQRAKLVTDLLKAHGCAICKGSEWHPVKYRYPEGLDLNRTLVHRLEAEGFAVFQMDSFAEPNTVLSDNYRSRAAA